MTEICYICGRQTSLIDGNYFGIYSISPGRSIRLCLFCEKTLNELEARIHGDTLSYDMLSSDFFWGYRKYFVEQLKDGNYNLLYIL